MTPAVQQRLAVSALIARCEAIAPSLAGKWHDGLLADIASVKRAFNADPPRLVQVGDHTAEEYDRTLDVVQE